MYPQHLLDPIPVPAVFPLLFVVCGAFYAAGYGAGQWWQRRHPEDTGEQAGNVVRMLLGLVAFLVAVTVGMAGDRFEKRSELVVDEANAIEAMYRRAGMVADPLRSEVRAALREYVSVRIDVDEPRRFLANVARSTQIIEGLHARLASQAQNPPPELEGLVDAVFEAERIERLRVHSVVSERVPEAIVLFMVFYTALALVALGFTTSQERKRSLASLSILLVVLSGVLTLVVDLDRPRDGLLRASPQPLVEVQQAMEPRPAGSGL